MRIEATSLNPVAIGMLAAFAVIHFIGHDDPIDTLTNANQISHDLAAKNAQRIAENIKWAEARDDVVNSNAKAIAEIKESIAFLDAAWTGVQLKEETKE